MTRLLAKLRSLWHEKRGSVPLHYTMVAAVTTIATMAVVQTANKVLADRLNAVTSILNKIQF